jgi:hypothetical protein
MGTQPQRPQTPQWIPYVGLMLAIAGIIYQGGVLSSSVQRNTERITRLEGQYDGLQTSLSGIDSRTARMEAKQDLMLQEAKR